MSPKSFGWQALTMQGSSLSSIDVFLLAKGVTSVVFSPSTIPNTKKKKNPFQVPVGCTFTG